jgi:dihydrofolate reductase/thymidylate synthase
MFDIIAAAHISNSAIGKNGALPWKNSADMKYFRELTTTTLNTSKINAVIMGRKTYDSIGAPLRNRVNVVLTRDVIKDVTIPNLSFQSSLEAALHRLGTNPNVENVFVIGGESVYKSALEHPQCRHIYLNLISTKCDVSDADAFFPTIDPDKYKVASEKLIASDVLNRVYIKIRE